jgi:hypothetical protein
LTSRPLSFWLALGACAALMLTPSAFPRQSGPGSLHIHELSGSIQQVGSYAAGGQRYPLFSVRLRATVCFRSAGEALKIYPDEFRITHYAVTKAPRSWWIARDVRDKPQWMVPFGETWRGRPCGAISVEDPIPVSHANLHSLGNPRGCYGVALGIRAGRAEARKRVVVKCGERF